MMVRPTRFLLVLCLMFACRKEGERSDVANGSPGPATPETHVAPRAAEPDAAAGREEPRSGGPETPPSAGTPPADASATDAQPPAEKEQPLAEEEPPLPSGEPLGHAVVPRLPSEAARRHNAAGMRAHRAAHYRRSVQSFAEAVKMAPDYDLVRYNLACALARLGRLAEAATELEVLLRRDLPSYAPRLAADPDLEGLRAAPEGAHLVNLVPALRAAWRSAVTSGIPVVASVAGSWQAGAYQLAEKRFLPATPWKAQAVGAGIDPAAGHAFVVEGKTDWDDTMDFFVETTVRVFSTATFEEVAVVPLPGRAYRVELALDSAGLSLAWGDMDEHRMTGWKRALFGDAAGLVPAERPQGWVFSFDPRGTVLEAPIPAGVEWKDNQVTLPGRTEPLPLGHGHAAADVHMLSLSADGRWLAVVSSRSSCDYGLDGGQRHFLDVVDVPAGTVRRLSEGDGPGYVRFDDAGGLLVQTGRTLRRWATPDAEAPDTLLDGVMLVAPLADPECGV